MKLNFTKIFMKNFIIFLAIFSLIFITNCTKNSNQILIDNGENLIRIKAEIADDDEERARGLMFRESLDENSGMLFVFDEEDYQVFWMKNTLIPLNMIFIDENLKIVDIKSAEPCKEEPCEFYQSSEPARYVIEVNSGFAVKNGIKTGDKAMLNKKILKTAGYTIKK